MSVMDLTALARDGIFSARAAAAAGFARPSYVGCERGATVTACSGVGMPQDHPAT